MIYKEDMKFQMEGEDLWTYRHLLVSSWALVT